MKPNWEDEYKPDPRKWDELTREEQDQVEQTVKLWVANNVIFKVDEKGRVLFRLKDDGTPEQPQ